MRSGTRWGAVAVAAVLTAAAVGASVVPNHVATVTQPMLIDGIPAELWTEMRESVCGDFDLKAPVDPAKFEGYENPVRVVEADYSP